jgi:hypothetical protein
MLFSTLTVYLANDTENSTAKVVGVSTVSQEEHTIAQTHELECTKSVLSFPESSVQKMSLGVL